MYVVDINKKVYKFLISLDNSQEIISKLKTLKHFKSSKSLNLDIKRFRGTKKNQEVYRLRIGEIRFIFEVFKEKNIIWIKAADYRGKVYN